MKYEEWISKYCENELLVLKIHLLDHVGKVVGKTGSPNIFSDLASE